MTNSDDHLENRLRNAFGAAAEVSTAEDLLDPAALRARSPRGANPRRIKGLATGSILGLGALALAGVLVMTVTLPTQAPLFTMAGPGGGAGVAEMSSDSSMGIWVDYEYVAGEGLGSQSGSGAVYELELQGTPEALLGSLGERFGVTGSPAPSQYFDAQWPLYVLGAEDWSAPSVNVTWNGTGNWYYNNPAAYPDPVCTEVPGSSEGNEPGFFDCVSPEPSGPLVSPERASELAQELFAATGLSVGAEDIRVLTNDEWGVGVAASLRVDNVDTALEWTMFWAPGPTLASASGHAVVVKNRGNYDTVSPRAAVDRMASGMWWGAPSPAYYNFEGGAQIALESEVAVREPDLIDPDAPVSSDDDVSDELPRLDPPSVVEPEVPGEAHSVRVIVTRSEATLLLVWDAAGNAWLVPGYVLRFGDDDWSWSAVISLIEGVIEVPEPTPVGLLPMPEPYIED